MTPDPHPPVPDHPQTPDGHLVHDPDGCWWCGDLTVVEAYYHGDVATRPPATATAKGTGS